MKKVLLAFGIGFVTTTALGVLCMAAAGDQWGTWGCGFGLATTFIAATLAGAGAAALVGIGGS